MTDSDRFDRTCLLRSGRVAELRTPSLPLVRHYHVLAWPKDQGPATPAEIDEMWSIAHAFARERGEALFGDPECFTVLYNGARTRRMPWPHFHVDGRRRPRSGRDTIVSARLRRALRPGPARTPGEKRWVLLCLSLKRLLRPRRWAITRRLLGA